LLRKGEYDFVGRVAGGGEYETVLDILAKTLRVRARHRNELCEA